MLPYGDGTILDASVANALEFCQRVILVTGYRGTEIEQRFQHHPRVQVTHNPSYEDGLFSSIQVGCKQVNSDYAFICHGDMPLLNYQIFSEIFQHRCNSPVMPVYRNSGGHPVLISKQIARQVCATAVDPSMPNQMRNLLRQHNPFKLTLDHPQITADVDTPSAYQELIQG